MNFNSVIKTFRFFINAVELKIVPHCTFFQILEKQHKASNPHGISREKKDHNRKKMAAGDGKRKEPVPKEKPDIWFDNVDPLLLESENENNNSIDGGRSKHKDDGTLENGHAAAPVKKTNEE